MAQALDMAQVDKSLENFVIPPRPDLLIRLQAEVDKPEPSIINIASIVEQDLAISEFTLKVVNSPLFAANREIKTINHACSILGLTKLTKVITSIILRYTFLNEEEPQSFNTKLWNSAAIIADACFAIGQFIDAESPDDAYTIGMFHNAGMSLIIEQQLNYPDILYNAHMQTEMPIGLYEEEAIDTSHEVLGFLIAQNWGLDHIISNVIAYHHSPSIILNTGSYTEKQLFCILKLAEHMVNLPAMLVNGHDVYEWEKISHQVLDILEIEDYQLHDLGELLFGFGVKTIYHS